VDFTRFIKTGRRILHYTAVIAIAVFIPLVIGVGERRVASTYSWYRVVDTEVLDVLEWARDNSAEGDVAIANETPRGGIIGWWVEGYSGIPTFFAVDTRWLVFKDEKAQAEIAHEMLSAEISTYQIQTLVQAHNIHMLILHKETLENPLTKLIDAGFINSYENGSMIVFTYAE